MKLISYRGNGGAESWGAVAEDGAVDFANLGFGNTLLEFIDAGRGAWDRASSLMRGNKNARIPFELIELLAPIPKPRRNVICIGVNYPAHAAESGHTAPTTPIYFSKLTTAVIGSGGEVVSDRTITERLDYEGELGVVIGAGGRNISVERALNHVFGYTIINDISARDIQHERPEGQWFLGKSLDGSCPMGPCIVTYDDIPNPQSLDIQTTVNGEMRQHSNTSEMVFSVRDIVADLSRYVTLMPGDIISTGTPSGVGAAMDPPRYLVGGDEVVVRIASVGELRCDIVGAGSTKASL